MPFSTFTGGVANHSAVSGDDPGTTGTQFKTLLDKAAVDTQAFINALIAELELATDGSSASERLGSGTVTGVTGNTVYAQIASLKTLLDNTTLGSIADDSLTDAKLSSTGVKADITALEKFPVATGNISGRELVIACSYFTLTAGMAVTFICSASNAGLSTTANVEGTGVTPIYKIVGGTAAPSFTANKPYTIWYNGASFFVKASAEGTATAADVLAGLTFSNSSDVGIVGTKVDRSGDTVALAISTSGTTIKLLASAGSRDGTNDYVTVSMSNLPGMKQFASGSGTTDVYGHLVISGLAFRPGLIRFYLNGNYVIYSLAISSTEAKYIGVSSVWPISISSDGFDVTTSTASFAITWVAYE